MWSRSIEILNPYEAVTGHPERELPRDGTPGGPLRALCRALRGAFRKKGRRLPCGETKPT